MHKLKIRLVNATAPLDQIMFTGERIKEISVDSLDDIESVIKQATEFLSTIEGANKTVVNLRVLKDNGSILLNGTFINGNFTNGILIS